MAKMSDCRPPKITESDTPIAKTIWEGPLEMKTGALSSSKVFVALFENDPTFYMLGEEFFSSSVHSANSSHEPFVRGLKSRRLKKGWFPVSLEAETTFIMPSGVGKNQFTLLIDRSDE